MTALENIKELRRLHVEATAILNSNADWEVKYDLIFSDEISGAVREIVHLSYYDPDTTYEEDVCAYMSALDQKIESLGDLGL